MTSARWWSTTYCSAFIICGKPWTPSVSAVGVVTSRMFAPGRDRVRRLDVERDLERPRATCPPGRCPCSWPAAPSWPASPAACSSLNVGMPGAQSRPPRRTSAAARTPGRRRAGRAPSCRCRRSRRSAIVSPRPSMPPAYSGAEVVRRPRRLRREAAPAGRVALRLRRRCLIRRDLLVVADRGHDRPGRGRRRRGAARVACHRERHRDGEADRRQRSGDRTPRKGVSHPVLHVRGRAPARPIGSRLYAPAACRA